MLGLYAKVLEGLAAKAITNAAERALTSASHAATPQVQVFDRYREHLAELDTWSDQVVFRDLSTPHRLHDIYVDLDLQVTPRRLSLTGDEPKISTVSDLRHLNRHIVLLGDVGAGKTTSMKRLCRYSIERHLAAPQHAPAPVLVRLRDLDTPGQLAWHILGVLGVGLVVDQRFEQELFAKARLLSASSANVAMTVLLDVLSQFPAQLYLDGLDEVRPAVLPSVLEEVRVLMRKLDRSFVTITCRSGAFDYSFDRAQVLELRALTRDQVTVFAHRWLGDDSRAEEFLSQLRRSPYHDTAVRPLTLAHLCALYSRYRRVPDKPKTAYRKIVALLLEEWDAQRSLRRSTEYSTFEVDRKQEFLEAMAYALSTEVGRSAFTHEELREIYQGICSDFGLPRQEAKAVAREIESHTGLVVQVSYERYAFAHKSLQEYLTAEYLVKAEEILSGPSLFARLPSEYAVAVALSARPSQYLAGVILGPVMALPEPQALELFLERLDVEKPDFGVYPVLAAGLFVLSDYVSTSVPFGNARERLASKLRRLGGLKNVRASIEAAEQYFEWTDQAANAAVLTYGGGIQHAFGAVIAPVLRIDSALIVDAWSPAPERRGDTSGSKPLARRRRREKKDPDGTAED